MGKPRRLLEFQTLSLAGLIGSTWWLPGMMKNMGRTEQAETIPEGDLPPVTVIVPARNEAHNIERCARSLLAQDYPDFELIVVDDGSTDATPRILAEIAASDSRLKVVTWREALPPGWAGKLPAIQMGYEAARPESRYILFSDADTFHFPLALVRWLKGDKSARRQLGFSLFQVLLMVFARRRFDRQLGVPALYAWTMPLSNLVFMGILIDSMIRSITGQGVSWKGRNYAGVARTQQLIK